MNLTRRETQLQMVRLTTFFLLLKSKIIISLVYLKDIVVQVNTKNIYMSYKENVHLFNQKNSIHIKEIRKIFAR